MPTTDPRYYERLTLHQQALGDEEIAYTPQYLGPMGYEDWEGEKWPLHFCEVHGEGEVPVGTPMYEVYSPVDHGAGGTCGTCLDAQIVGTYRPGVWAWAEDVATRWSVRNA